MKVKMYTTPFCKYCKVAKEFFKSKQISYEEVDITKDQNELAEMVAKTHQMSVPVFDIGGKILVGFNRSEIKEALKVA